MPFCHGWAACTNRFVLQAVEFCEVGLHHHHSHGQKLFNTFTRQINFKHTSYNFCGEKVLKVNQKECLCEQIDICSILPSNFQSVMLKLHWNSMEFELNLSSRKWHSYSFILLKDIFTSFSVSKTNKEMDRKCQYRNFFKERLSIPVIILAV